ncbi:hypothetical protein CF8_0027 [Aeromonas phage CF8]|nr:hypothetical protein CF8_0027 [Aeromonas phage CF8]
MDIQAKQVFLDNLSAIISNDNLLRQKPIAGEDFVELVINKRRKLDVFTSAVFVYFTNVITQRGYLAGNIHQFRIIHLVAEVLTTAFVLYDTGRGHPDFNNRTKEQLMAWIDKKLEESFSYGLPDCYRPSAQSLKYIMDDFDRLVSVAKQR